MVYLVIPFTVVVVIIIGIIWFCKKHHVKSYSDTQLQSDTAVITNASFTAVELHGNPAYVATHRKEAQTDNIYEELDVTDNPPYTPFLKCENEVIPALPSRQEATNRLYKRIEKDAQNTEKYD